MADIRIDTSGLTDTKFSIPGYIGEFIDGASAPTISLPPGTYSFQQGFSQPAFTFEVMPNGHVAYDSVNDNFLGGRESETLTVRGFAVTLDATSLSHDLALVMEEPVALPRDRVHHLILVPAEQYMFFLARGLADFSFAVTPEGQVRVEPRFSGFAEAGGPDNRTLTIRGYKVTLDFRALSHDLAPELLGWTAGALPRATAHELTLIPAQVYMFFLSRGHPDFSFAVTPEGQVRVEPRFSGFAEAGGPDNRTLTIRGYKVTLDFRALSHDLAPELLGWTAGALPRASTHELTLIPAQVYMFFLSRGHPDFSFAVTPEGQVRVEPRFSGFAEAGGPDNRTLTIRGYKVTLDFRALSHDLAPELLGWTAGALPRATAHELTLIPAQVYMFFLSRGHPDFSFAVTPEGQVRVEPRFSGFAEAGGPDNRTLTIRGYKVTLDFRALSHDLAPELLGWTAGALPRASTHELTLIPAQVYMFFLSRGHPDFSFAVTPEGQVRVEPRFSGFAEAGGPDNRTLTIRGYKVTLDFRALSHDLAPELLGWTAGALPRASTHELTLIPAQVYMFFLSRGHPDFSFAVTPEGQVRVEPRFSGFAEAGGPDNRTLTIRGYKVTLDFRALSHDLAPELLGNSDVLSRATAHELTLIPAERFLIQIGGRMADFEFRLDTDGILRIDKRFTRFSAIGTNRTLMLAGYRVIIDSTALTYDLLLTSVFGGPPVLQHETTQQLTLLPAVTYALRSLQNPAVELLLSLDTEGHLGPAA